MVGIVIALTFTTDSPWKNLCSVLEELEFNPDVSNLPKKSRLH
ncbi:MAG: hypothetical protein ACTHME_04880 [Candidatus Nitrosocosmicus sp.]